MDPAYVIDALKKAPEYYINTVVYSHRMIKDVPELFDDPKRVGILTMLADEAHKYDLKVWLWLHELEGVPDRFLASSTTVMSGVSFRICRSPARKMV